MAEFQIYPSDENFERFWQAFPKKMKKGDAKKAWHQTESIRPPIERILNTITAMSTTKQWTEQEGRYVPLPASWLRGEGWDDEPEVKANGKPWWSTASGIEAKAKSLGLTWDQTRESFPEFAKRVRARDAESSNVVQLKVG